MKIWKSPNIKKIHIPRNRCEKVVSLIDWGYPLNMIAEKTGYPKKQILAISLGRYDLKDQYSMEGA